VERRTVERVTGRLLRPLPRSFYRRPSPAVAPDLLGRLLVRVLPGLTLVGRIVEAEAYQEDDPASHSFRGLTARTAVMFGPPGHLYVYLSYGNHWCMNVVTGRTGEGSAVLLRAAEPVDGIEPMRVARGIERIHDLCSGPGKLAQAFGVSKEQNGWDLVSGGGLYLSSGEGVPGSSIGAGPRVGISVATDRPWRFFEKGSPFVSRPSPGLATTGRPRRAEREQPTARTRPWVTGKARGEGA
jgi:DNA-3-methyladenine glycosylase